MKVDVKRRHISNGLQEDPTRCPVALALNDIGLRRCMVGRYSFNPSSNHLDVSVELPSDVTTRIQSFDATGEMKPFSFEIPDRVMQYKTREPDVL